MLLAKPVVLITGASAGIGRQLAIQFAGKHSGKFNRLVLAARNERRLAEVAEQCVRLGAEAIAVPTDVTSLDQCRRLVATAVDRFGRLDVLVNNAGRAMWSRFDELTEPKVMEELMRVNYLGSVYPTFFALPHLKASRGLIVAMSSVSGLSGVPILSGYAASKHALMGFFESLRIELSASGVDVTIIAPDFVQSEIFDRSFGPAGNELGESPLDQNQMMATERCAARIVRAIERRERLTLMSVRAKALRWGKLLAPGLVDWLVARAMTPNVGGPRRSPD